MSLQDAAEAILDNAMGANGYMEEKDLVKNADDALVDIVWEHLVQCDEFQDEETGMPTITFEQANRIRRLVAWAMVRQHQCTWKFFDGIERAEAA